MKSCPPKASLGSSPGDAATRVRTPQREPWCRAGRAGSRGARATPRDAAARMPRVTARSNSVSVGTRVRFVFADCDTLSIPLAGSRHKSTPAQTVNRREHPTRVRTRKYRFEKSAVPRSPRGSKRRARRRRRTPCRRRRRARRWRPRRARRRRERGRSGDASAKRTDLARVPFEALAFPRARDARGRRADRASQS